MSCARENWIGAESSSPIAAATRSNVRVAPYPMGAALSASLRSLLLVAAGAASFRIFFLNGHLQWPCAAYRRVPSTPPRSPLLPILHPAHLPPAPPLPLSNPPPTAL